jgi:hypothetical protein
MLSSGEFVVNAENTRKNLKLLRAINEGRTPIQQLARGGVASLRNPRVQYLQAGGVVQGGGFMAGDVINNITVQPMPGQPQPRVDAVQIGATVARMTRDAQRRGISS